MQKLNRLATIKQDKKREDEDRIMNKKEFTPKYKTKIVLEVIEGNMMSSEIAARKGINPKQVSAWKQEFLKNAARAFTLSTEEKAAKKELIAAEEREKELMAKVGILTMENDWLKKKSEQVLGYKASGSTRYSR